MIAQELEVSLHMAFMDARQKRHEFITVEHLLLALLDNPSALAATGTLFGRTRWTAASARDRCGGGAAPGPLRPACAQWRAEYRGVTSEIRHAQAVFPILCGIRLVSAPCAPPNRSPHLPC